MHIRDVLADKKEVSLLEGYERVSKITSEHDRYEAEYVEFGKDNDIKYVAATNLNTLVFVRVDEAPEHTSYIESKREINSIGVGDGKLAFGGGEITKPDEINYPPLDNMIPTKSTMKSTGSKVCFDYNLWDEPIKAVSHTEDSTNDDAMDRPVVIYGYGSNDPMYLEGKHGFAVLMPYRLRAIREYLIDLE